MTNKIEVIKRDGEKEDFETEKILKVLKAAGLSEEKATIVAKEVEKWVYALEKESVTSLEIRDKVLDELRKTDNNIANFYQWYQKTKEN